MGLNRLKVATKLRPLPKTPYAVLLVRPSDSDAVVRERYYEMAELYHPDKEHPGDAEASGEWHEINTAYQAIKTAHLRGQLGVTITKQSRLCGVCHGTGVTGMRLGKQTVMECLSCEGKGRTE